jgi:hypothetical protein
VRFEHFLYSWSRNLTDDDLVPWFKITLNFVSSLRLHFLIILTLWSHIKTDVAARPNWDVSQETENAKGGPAAFLSFNLV